MGKGLFDAEGPPSTPGTGAVYLFPHSGTLRWTQKDETGKVLTLAGLRNSNIADVVASAADTYLTGSSITIPSHLLQVGTRFRWTMWATKTAAGTATPIWNVRVGVAGTTADTARLTFTGPAQTAAVDAGRIEIDAIVRVAGASGILAGGLVLSHNLAATGFANVEDPHLQVTSSAFDMTVASLIVGVSVDPGASGVWTHQVVVAEAWGI